MELERRKNSRSLYGRLQVLRNVLYFKYLAQVWRKERQIEGVNKIERETEREREGAR